MRSGSRGFGRTALAAALTATVVGALLLRSGAAAAPPAPPVVDDGRGLAGATVLSVAPTTGALELAVTSGQVRAETAGGLSQSLARSFSLGLIGSALTAGGCDGGQPLVEDELLPAALRVDNRSGPASLESTEVPLLAPVLGVGTERVSADLTPAARAEMITGDAQLSPLLRIAGGRATAESVVLPGDGRRAAAGVSIDVDILGLVTITGMRWDASHRSGDTEASDAGFSIGGLSIGGVPVPVDLPLSSLEPIGELINAALTPLGFTVELPRIERITEPVDLVRITPLHLRVADTPTSAVLGPVLEATREFRSTLFEELVKADCSLASALLVGDIVAGVASGTGALVLSIGGAEASSGDVIEENPFGEVPPLPPAAGVANPPEIGAAPPPPGAPQAVGDPPASLRRGPGERSCESSHPNRAPGCSRGSVATAGLVGTIATLGVAAADLRRRRHAEAAARATALANGDPGAAS